MGQPKPVEQKKPPVLPEVPMLLMDAPKPKPIIMCQGTPLGPKSQLLVEVGVPQRSEMVEGYLLSPLKDSCNIGDEWIKPTCTPKTMKYDVGDLNGDGARDYFVLEERDSKVIFYAESGKRKSCVSEYFRTTSKISEVKIKKCDGCSDQIFTITLKEQERNRDSKSEKKWSSVVHERVLVIGARNLLECLYPQAVQKVGCNCPICLSQWKIVDDQGNAIDRLPSRPLALGSFDRYR